MDDKSSQTPTPSDADIPGSLESAPTVIVSKPGVSEPATPLSATLSNDAAMTGGDSTGGSSSTTPSPSTSNHSKRLLARLGPNIYLMALVVIVLIAIAVVVFAVLRGNKSNQSPTINSQTLTPAELNQLQGSSTVGSSSENLTIESDTSFGGSILVKNNASVAGTLTIGKSLVLPVIAVSGSSNLGQVNAINLTVTGASIVQGNLTAQKNLTVAGTGTFSGAISAPQITTPNLQLQGDLQITQHITSTGSTPGKTDNNSALGSGGTASVQGNDTAGTVIINTGQSPQVGCFMTLTFSRSFSTTPHVVISPISAAAAGIQYYVTPSGTGFSVCTADTAPSSQSFSFDYFVID